MKWEKVPSEKSIIWRAVGENGMFAVYKTINKRNRFGTQGYWEGRYISSVSAREFDIPRQRSIKDIKNLCKNNHYWEGAVVKERAIAMPMAVPVPAVSVPYDDDNMPWWQK